MQLTGPPRLTGWEAPQPSKRTPLQAAFERDTDLETYVKTRDGREHRRSPRHYRGRFRYGWQAISYDMAHAILSEVSKHPVELVPRTKRSSDVGYLSEQTYDCRLVSQLPTSTQIFRTTGDGRVARIEIELLTIDTYNELPEAVTGGVQNV